MIEPYFKQYGKNWSFTGRNWEILQTYVEMLSNHTN